jgi:hypothetical protein
MARHKNPQYNRKRLVVAGIAAVATLGAAVGIGIYGSAFADRGNQNPAASEQCLPTDSAPPPEETAPPEGDENNEEAPPAEGEDQGQNENEQGQEDQEQGQGQEDQGQEQGQEDQDQGDANAPGTPIEDPNAEGQNNDNEDQQDGRGGQRRFAGGDLVSLNAANPNAPGQGQPGGGNGGGGNGGGNNGGQNGGQNGGGNGGNNGGGQDDDGIDYGGPKPPEQAPEPPAEAPMDEFPGGEECEDALGPFPEDFIDINDVEPNNLAADPEVQEGGTSGTFTVECGNNENGHFNSANMIAAPGNENGAQHTHDYVGNVTTDGFSDNESLAEGDTTCENGDQSAYFWPVIRVRNEGSDAVDPLNAHNVGDIADVDATIQFRGNASNEVTAAPRFLRILTGDAKSSTNGGANANAKWTCTGFEDRITTKYPLCPEGSQTVRIADFPSCTDGNTDSANHRDHLAFVDENGDCPDGFEVMPQLRITLKYDLPQGKVFALDAFPDEKHNPITDHNDFVNVMSEELMNQVVDCINSGQQC